MPLFLVECFGHVLIVSDKLLQRSSPLHRLHELLSSIKVGLDELVEFGRVGIGHVLRGQRVRV